VHPPLLPVADLVPAAGCVLPAEWPGTTACQSVVAIVTGRQRWRSLLGGRDWATRGFVSFD